MLWYFQWFVHQVLHQTIYLLLEVTVHIQAHVHVDEKVADMMYVVEVTEPRNFDEPYRVRRVNNVAQRIARHNGKQLQH